MNQSQEFAPLPFAVSLTTRFVGRRLYFSPEVDSTNRLLRELTEWGAREGTLVLTDHQVAGRGRQGRSWTEQPGSSILVSLLLLPTAIESRISLLPLVIAVAVARALENALALSPTLKWPNDVLLDGKKCCGILIETVVGPTQVLIVGIGLNVNQELEQFAELPGATSLRIIEGKPLDRGRVLSALLEEIEAAVQAFRGQWSPLDEWRARARMLGQPVLVQPSVGSGEQATALDITDEGALLVRWENGKQSVLHAADITVRQL